MKDILITGAKGFVGRNMTARIKNIEDRDINILEYDIDNTDEDLKEMLKEADIIYHFAGVNRPDNIEEFKTGNYGLTDKIVNILKANNRKTPIVFSSSIQAELDNPYGQSKKLAEDSLIAYSEETGAGIFIFRFPNLFGKWSRPNYNSVVSTFCYNIANDLDIEISDREHTVEFAYIDNVIDKFIEILKGELKNKGHFYEMQKTFIKTLGELADLIYSFKKSRENRVVPVLSDEFTKDLYSTYLSYLPKDKFSYELQMHTDKRGSFTEFIRTRESGQVSVNISKPGITKGEHWHDTKNEKFLVVSGEGIIRFRKIGEDEVIEYKVSGENMEVVDIPPGYTHNIENTGKTDMVTVMWANECFDPDNPDTFFEEV